MQKKRRQNKYAPKHYSHVTRECGNKRTFTAIAGAKAYAHQLQQELGDHMRAYRCTWCGHWHVGHSKGKGSFRG